MKFETIKRWAILWFTQKIILFCCAIPQNFLSKPSPIATFLFVFGDNSCHYSPQKPLLFPCCLLHIGKVPQNKILISHTELDNVSCSGLITEKQARKQVNNVFVVV